MIRLIFLFSLVFLYVPLAFAENVVVSAVLPATDLIKVLQSGGHILYMRHGVTDHSQKDISRRNLDDCLSQRNLSEVGVEQSKKIGRTIKSLKIPVSEVASSPYCRCKDTARLVFGEFRVEPDLQFSISKNEKESKKLGDRLYQMMLSSSDVDENVIFVGHTSNLRDGLGVWPKPEGAIVVFKKEGGKLIHRGIIKPSEWPDQSL